MIIKFLAIKTCTKNELKQFFWFVCLPLSISVHLFGDATITGEGLQILTYARHSEQLSSHRSLTFIMVISARTHDTHFCCQALAVALSLPVIMTYRMRGERTTAEPRRRYSNISNTHNFY